jgi:hypothetical protein
MVRFRVTFKSGRQVVGSATDYDEAAAIASRLLDPDDENKARSVDLLPFDELRMWVDDGSLVAHD